MGLLCETVLVPKKRCTPISFPCSIWVPHGTTFDEGKTKFHKRRLDWIDCDDYQEKRKKTRRLRSETAPIKPRNERHHSSHIVAPLP